MRLGPHLIDAVRLKVRTDDGSRDRLDGFFIASSMGTIRVIDSRPGRADLPIVVIAPDGPNAVEHYTELVRHVGGRLRVVVFDLPGFGHSVPSASFRFRLEDGARATLDVLDALGIHRATLAFPCANGYYAVAVACQAPERVAGLVLAQTPSYAAMRAWMDRRIPRLIRTPFVGQLVGALASRALARRWYRAAAGDREASDRLRTIADTVFDAGGCFCLAGIVQGLARGSERELAGMQVPIRAVWGAHDRSHLASASHSITDMFPGTEVEVYADSGHFPDLERPSQFAELLVHTCG